MKQTFVYVVLVTYCTVQ